MCRNRNVSGRRIRRANSRSSRTIATDRCRIVIAVTTRVLFYIAASSCPHRCTWTRSWWRWSAKAGASANSPWSTARRGRPRYVLRPTWSCGAWTGTVTGEYSWDRRFGSEKCTKNSCRAFPFWVSSRTTVIVFTYPRCNIVSLDALTN